MKTARQEMQLHLLETGIPSRYLNKGASALARILPGALSLCCHAPLRYKNVDPRDTTVECAACRKELGS